MLTKETKQKAEAVRQDVADILAACSMMAKVWEKKGKEYQRTHAEKIAREWVESSALIGGALWFCGDSETPAACTFADGFRVRCIGWVRGLVLPVLFLQDNEENERAQLVRFEW